jgi:hypothetical protein
LVLGEASRRPSCNEEDMSTGANAGAFLLRECINIKLILKTLNLFNNIMSTSSLDINMHTTRKKIKRKKPSRLATARNHR